MTWREQTICRILLIVARILCADPIVDQELKHLSTHIGVHGAEAEGCETAVAA